MDVLLGLAIAVGLWAFSLTFYALWVNYGASMFSRRCVRCGTRTRHCLVFQQPTDGKPYALCRTCITGLLNGETWNSRMST